MKVEKLDTDVKRRRFLVFTSFFRQKRVTFCYLREKLQDHDSGNRRQNSGEIILLPKTFSAGTYAHCRATTVFFQIFLSAMFKRLKSTELNQAALACGMKSSYVRISDSGHPRSTRVTRRWTSRRNKHN